MNTHEAHCPSCAQIIHFPMIHFPVEPPAITSRVRCPSCRASLRVWLDRLAALSSPEHASRRELSHARPHRQNGRFLGPHRDLSGNTQVSTVVCPHCGQGVTEYRFTTRDGFSIVTHHCVEHGDVIPKHHVDAPNDPPVFHF
ncbi:MAG: hypothetical protein H6976_16495 [Gammaproteobacteria bacterium]|nr:hypothetical protein [Gammaproteobacteria bacterium]